MSKTRLIAWCGLCVATLFLISCTPLVEGTWRIDQEQYSDAIPFLETAIKEESDPTDARRMLGYAYLKTGNLDGAIVELEKVLETKPGDPHAILYVGMAYLNKERFDDAIKAWKSYRDKKQPLIESEIKRLLSLLQISESQQAAKKALASEESLKTAKPDNNAVAVCYFEDLSSDKSLKAFQKGLAAMVITDLSKVKSLKVIERLHLQALLMEMALGQTGIVDAKTAPRVGRLLGAESLITGSLSTGSFKVMTSLASTTAESIKGTATITVEQEDFFKLPSLIIRDMAKIMNIALSQEEIAAIGIPHTKNYKAFIYYGEALNAVDEGRWQDALDLFEKAFAEDPDFDLAREGKDSSPASSSPGMGQLSSMTTTQVASQIDSVVSAAADAQSESDARSEAESAQSNSASGASAGGDSSGGDSRSGGHEGDSGSSSGGGCGDGSGGSGGG